MPMGRRKTKTRKPVKNDRSRETDRGKNEKGKKGEEIRGRREKTDEGIVNTEKGETETKRLDEFEGSIITKPTRMAMM